MQARTGSTRCSCPCAPAGQLPVQVPSLQLPWHWMGSLHWMQLHSRHWVGRLTAQSPAQRRAGIVQHCAALGRALVVVQRAGVAVACGWLVAPERQAVPHHALDGEPHDVVAARVGVQLPAHATSPRQPLCATARTVRAEPAQEGPGLRGGPLGAGASAAVQRAASCPYRRNACHARLAGLQPSGWVAARAAAAPALLVTGACGTARARASRQTGRRRGRCAREARRPGPSSGGPAAARLAPSRAAAPPRGRPWP